MSVSFSISIKITAIDVTPRQLPSKAILENLSPVRRGGSKLTEGSFSPTSFRLAKLGKSIARQSIALNDAFPDDKELFLWNGISKSAANDEKLADAIRRAISNDQQKEKLIKYVSVIAIYYLPYILFVGWLWSR